MKISIIIVIADLCDINSEQEAKWLKRKLAHRLTLYLFHVH